jgi:hypothetical protein
MSRSEVSIRLSEEKKLAADALFSMKAFKLSVGLWFREQIPLAETFCLALAFHVAFFPVIWCAGWALPWPKSPVITTVIEIDLQAWRHNRRTKPGKVIYIREPERNDQF